MWLFYIFFMMITHFFLLLCGPFWMITKNRNDKASLVMNMSCSNRNIHISNSYPITTLYSNQLNINQSSKSYPELLSNYRYFLSSIDFKDQKEKSHYADLVYNHHRTKPILILLAVPSGAVLEVKDGNTGFTLQANSAVLYLFRLAKEPALQNLATADSEEWLQWEAVDLQVRRPFLSLYVNQHYLYCQCYYCLMLLTLLLV